MHRLPPAPSVCRCSHRLEALESRLCLDATTFAVVGDFGTGGGDAYDVAKLIYRKAPDFVLTVGDNNYGDRFAMDQRIGRIYQSFIHPYDGAYGDGSPDDTNRFFPVLGNHDWEAGLRAHEDYFRLPGNERYYTFKNGPVQFFAISSDKREPDLDFVDGRSSTASSPQGRWLKQALAESTARYKIVYMHHPPYSSGDHGSSRWMQWPYRKWGATAVIAGHDHNYERIDKAGTPFFINGLGGKEPRDFVRNVSGSQVRYSDGFGAMFVNADLDRIVFKFVTRGGELIDRYTVTAVPAAPADFSAHPLELGGIELLWSDRSATESFFKLQRSEDGVNFVTIARPAGNSGSYVDTTAIAGVPYTYRLRAINRFGSSDWVTTSVEVTPVPSAAPAAAAAPASPRPRWSTTRIADDILSAGRDRLSDELHPAR